MQILPDFHLIAHVIEVLCIAYVMISQHQTKQMLLHITRTVSSVNDHLDALVTLSEFEVLHERKAISEDFAEEETEEEQ